jgi:D-alanine--poly(phosphoribitol) ligase subunit 1
MYFVKWSRDLVKENMENSEEAITFMNQAPFSFDLSVMDLYTSLAMGGKLVCLDKQLQSDVGALFEYLKQERINCWVSTPSFAAMCLADKSFCQDNFPDIKLFMFCGERFALETARLLAERFPNATVINTYGPTESTVAVTSVVITPEILAKEDLIPIGLPKPGTTLDIKDEEIIIIGDTVGHGYFNNEEKTQAAFFTIQDEKGNSYRAYKTGDKGYFKDGTYYCSGRMDNQIKLHGYRIELGDIEANLMQCKDVEQAAVLPKYEDGVIKSLVAFVKAPNLDGQFKDVKYIKEQLKEKLPAYMIPKNIKFLDSMPITANGKLDRNKLKEGAL